MKATGVVRRIEACVIIGQTALSPYDHWAFHWFALLNTLVSKLGFWWFLYIEKARWFHLAFCFYDVWKLMSFWLCSL